MMELTNFLEQFRNCFEFAAGCSYSFHSPLCIMQIHSLFYDHSEEGKMWFLENELRIWIFLKKDTLAVVLVSKI